MQFIYLHGRDSSPDGFKGRFFEDRIKSGMFFAPYLHPDFSTISLQEKIEIAKEHIDEETVVIGSSLGGYIASIINQTQPVKAMILIAPAVNFLKRHPEIKADYPDFPRLLSPTIVFAGEEDHLVPLTDIEEFTRINSLIRLVRFPDGDHRMHGKLERIWELAQIFLDDLSLTEIKRG